MITVAKTANTPIVVGVIDSSICSRRHRPIVVEVVVPVKALSGVVDPASKTIVDDEPALADYRLVRVVGCCTR